MPQRTIAGQRLVRLASVRTFNAEARTVDLVFTTGHKGKRTGWLGDEWFEELEVSEKAIRLERLNSGAPLLDTHDAYKLRDVIGVVEGARIEGGLGIVTVRFSKREDVEPIWRDVTDGIIRNVSVGYRVHKWADVTEGDDKVKTYRAVDWEPMEVSLVPIGFDPGAQTRAAAADPFTTEIISARAADNEGEHRMPPEDNKTPQPEQRSAAPAPAAPAVDEAKVRAEAAEAERKRGVEIRELVRKARLDEKLADDYVSRGLSLDQARTAVLEALVARDAASPTNSQQRIEVGTPDSDKRAAAVENAIMNRGLGDKVVKLDAGREFRGYSLLELGRRWLEAQGVRTDGWDRQTLARECMRVRAGMHTTSDFTYVLANVATKSLLNGYDQASALQTFTPFVKFGMLPNFLEAKRVGMGEAPNLTEVPESGEIPSGTSANRGEAIQLKSFGRIFPISRQALINDELGALTSMPSKFGAAAARLEADKVYAVLTSNPTMGDSVALFHSTHANLADSGGAISVTTLGAGFAAMRKQTGVNAADVLNVIPAFLVVPAANEALALQYVSQITPEQGANVNPFAGRLQVIVDARLDSDDSNQWFLIADPKQGWDTIELATLDGVRAPQVETEVDFDTGGIKVKATHDVVAKALDWRTMYMNDGGA